MLTLIQLWVCLPLYNYVLGNPPTFGVWLPLCNNVLGNFTLIHLCSKVFTLIHPCIRAVYPTFTAYSISFTSHREHLIANLLVRVGGNQENIPFILFPALGVVTDWEQCSPRFSDSPWRIFSLFRVFIIYSTLGTTMHFRTRNLFTWISKSRSVKLCCLKTPPGPLSPTSILGCAYPYTTIPPPPPGCAYPYTTMS